MIIFALAALLVTQDTTLIVSPQVRAMVEEFRPPKPGDVAVATRFSRDTVWVGEQVEFVTVAWFPRPLRDRLRHTPGITPPSLSGLWSARTQSVPQQEETRVIGHVVYDLYVIYQTIFPLAPGRVEAPPAVLSYGLPTSTSYFAPEERRTVSSAPAVLVARPIPAALTAALGSGPTAHDLKVAWRGPVGGLQAGAPTIVELDVAGAGNLTLWPAPQIAWPADVHVYPEPTDERSTPSQGIIGGEKHFRYTVVADSAGVLAFPQVSYPYFDPGTRDVRVAVTAPLSLAIRPRAPDLTDRPTLPVTSSDAVPVATTVILHWGWLLILIALSLPLLVVRPRLPRRRRIVPVPLSPEDALREALGAPVDAGPDHVVAALRRRGVPREDAELVRRWLDALARRRYGVAPAAPPEPPAALSRVLARLRAPIALLILLAVMARGVSAQGDDATTRYRAGDYAGATRAYAAALHARPDAPDLWRNLGAARWMNGDEVGATAAWLRTAALAPRDPLLQLAWTRAVSIPPDIRSLAPTLPLSRDEILLVAFALWAGAWILAAAQWRRAGIVAGVASLGLLVVALARTYGAARHLALITAATQLHISPHPATLVEGEFPAWALVQVRRHVGDWILVEGVMASSDALPGTTVAGWVPAAAVAAVGPLD